MKLSRRHFQVIKNVYQGETEAEKDAYGDFKLQSRIIFPKYSKQYNGGETHISEQELRFTFVEQFNKGWFYKYLYISSEVIGGVN